MTNDTISIEQIQATKTYGLLNTIQQSFCIKRKNRQSLTDALIVYRNTNVIPGCIFGYNLGLLGDLIKIEQTKLQKKENTTIENWNWERKNNKTY